ncbi:peptidoglycan DD-metalloendopeptidase family protein [Streptomyces sp. AV19]|uniref:M23 family metallopeptidase n=1 Tax=Streptomyces sp. AV19 TaxID=2793068 RepID=UPI0018FE2D00|nr:M23 family metallopeptidase [Streptomyces sp. AV19]MBH1934549.1 peptidoglycan DD-metalloendopeptidase family protein [Streptomyces sp. AV19]MDG4530902.1 peptidoglycan DD-metalloendopeptidase family protein [Streptomyces sp. AV19]
MARGGAALGVGVIAAVGAGSGVATAQERPAPITVPDVDPTAATAGPYAVDDDEVPAAETPVAEAASGSEAPAPAQGGPSDAGEALRARILQQAEPHSAAQERAAADAQRMAAAKARAAATHTTQRAAHTAQNQAQHTAQNQAQHTAQNQAHSVASATDAANAAGAANAAAAHGAAVQKAAAKATGKAQAEARRAAERITRAKHRYVLPVSSYRITARYGQHGGMWSHRHTGTDFAAPTGSPVKAVSGGRITHAGWAGSYGYRIVLRLDDGTELWFCHLSSMVRTQGKVVPGQVIGRVGATGNVTGAHLHLEVRQHGGHPVDPLHWLRSKGLHP